MNDVVSGSLRKHPRRTSLRPVNWIRSNHPLLIALCASLALHLAATGGNFGWLSPRAPADGAQFEAVLVTTKTPEEAPLTLRVNPSRALKPVRKTAPRQRTQKSDAPFAAPENAIAVDRPVSEIGADVGVAGLEKDGRLADAEVMADPQSPVPSASEAIPVAAEKPALPEAQLLLSETARVVELPSRVWIAFKATTSVADGVAHYSWKREGTKYSFESTIQATGFFVEMFVGTITQQSSGEVTAAGIEPALFTIRRGDREPETAEFQRMTKEVKLSRGSESRQIPMPANLQDTQSFLFQLAVEAPKLKTAEDRLTISVTNARGINRYTFKKVGEALLETRLGAVETVHLVRETSEPRDGYEAWLSPKHHYLPVKLKFFLDRFPAELIATNITSKP